MKPGAKRVWAGWAGAVLAVVAATTDARAADADFRVALVAGAEPAVMEAPTSLARLRTALELHPGLTVSVTAAQVDGRELPSLEILRTADAAVLHGGTGVLTEANAAILRQFLQAGKGLVVIRENTGAWNAWPDFAASVLGAKRKGAFAGGEPMRVINLFAHAVFTGISRLESRQSMPLYDEPPADAMMVMEGTVGEATAPLAWLRPAAGGRVAHVLPSEPALFRQPEYLRFLANAVHWVARRPIAGARALVQRTYLSDAYPGAIAITLPDGPTACFDPTRGGVSQVATGDFVDLRPRWLTKRGEPARLDGELVFQDPGRGPLWSGGREDAPAFRFKGYRVGGAYPEFHYQVAGREIREVIRRAPPPAAGLVRELHIGAGAQPLRYQHEPELRGTLSVRGANAEARGFTYDSPQAGVVTIEIRLPRVRGR